METLVKYNVVSIMIYLSLLLYFGLALLVTLRLFTELSLSKFFISLFICVTLGNILVAQLLHFIRALDSPLAFLLIQLVLCAAAGFALIDPKGRIFHSRLPRFHQILNKPDWTEGLVFTLILLVLTLAIYIGTLSPINNSDSLHTHLPRIYYWIQHGSMQSWNASAPTQVFYPINIAVQGAWLFLLSGSEIWLFATMWLALVTTTALIFEIARQLGANRLSALVAALVSLSFPVVLLQTYSYQGDVFVVTLVMASVFFLLKYQRELRKADLVLSILMAVVSVGAKQTSFLYIPVFLLALVIVLWRRLSVRQLLPLAGFTLAFFLIFSSFKFIQNLSETQVEETSMIDPGFIGYLMNITREPPEKFLVNGMRYLYQSVSLHGLNGNLLLNLDHAKQETFRAITSWMKIDLESRAYIPEGEDSFFTYDTRWPLNEDGAWYGPLSFTLLTAAIIAVLAGKYKLRKRYLWLVLLLLILFIFGQVIIKGDGWGPNRGRHMAIPVLLLTPLLAFLLPSKKVIGALMALSISLLAAYLAFSVLLINESRPLITTNSLYAYLAREIDTIKVTNIVNAQYKAANEKAVRSLLLTSPDRSNILDSSYYERLFYQSTTEIPGITFVNENIPADEDLYVHIGDRTLLEFALFGVNRTRNLFPVRVINQVPPGSYLLVSNTLLDSLPQDTRLVAENDEYSIIYKP